MRTRAGALAFVLAVAWAVGPAAESEAQAAAQRNFAPDAFLDPVAREVYVAAVERWHTLDESILRYTARIEQRMAAAVRAPLKDRVLYRNETAVRAFWDRDHDPVVQVLGTRSSYPGRDIAVREGDLDWLDDLPFDEPFQPGGDRLLFGMADSDEDYMRVDVDDRGAYESGDAFWFAHPLADEADAFYRFRSGDTLTVSLPDGRRLQAVELEVLPREADAHRITGALWIEPGSGALVRAVYRLSREFDAIRDVPELQTEDARDAIRWVPGIFKPWTFDLKMIAVDYGLWDFRVWLPRSMRVEGEAAAGIVKLPVSMDVSYQIESVTTEEEAAGERATDLQARAEDAAGSQAAAGPEDDLQEAHFDTREDAMAFIASLLSEGDVPYVPMEESERPAQDREALLIVPAERSRVAESPHLPPPIWEEATGFPSDDELEAYVRSLAKLPAPPLLSSRFRYGFGPVRYNRVEGLAAGGRLGVDLGRRYSVRATALLGLANLRPDVRVELERSTVLRRLSLELYHELRATDRQNKYFRLGGSANAFFFGNDWGDYYRATGAGFVWRPPAVARESYEVRVFGEHQRSVEVHTDFALFKAFSDGWAFRPNPPVDEIVEGGVEVRAAPWWGTDPTASQFGLEMRGRAALWRPLVGGKRARYAEARVVVRAALPLTGGEWSAWRLGGELAGGTVWGKAPRQRAWYVGGTGTLRGFRPGTASGPTFARGRLEVARTYHAVGASLFGDMGWAGALDYFESDHLLYGIGIGATVMDGLLRFDVARGLNGPNPSFSVHLHVDAIL